MRHTTRSTQPYGEPRARWTIPRGPFRPPTINARTAGDLVRGRTPHAA